MSDIQAGRLEVPVEGDARGFARGLQAKIDAQTRDIKARIKMEVDDRALRRDLTAATKAAQERARVRIKAEIDTRGLAAATAAAAKQASANAKIRLVVEVDTRGLNAQVRAIAKEASDQAKVRLGIDLDTGAVRSEVKAAAAAAKAEVPVDADTAAAETKIDRLKAMIGRVRANVVVDAATRAGEASVARFKRWIDSQKAKVKVDVDSSGLAKGSLAAGLFLGKMSAIVDGIGSLIGPALSLAGGLGQVVGGLFAIVSAAGPAAGALALLPAALAAVGQVVGTIKAAFSGVGDALKAMGAAQAKSGADAQAAAAKQASAAKAVASAQKGVEAAHRRVQDAARQAQAAQRGLVAAEQAVADAREKIALQAQSNADSIIAAQRRVADANANVAATAKSGAASIAAAEQQVIDAQVAAKRAQEDLTQARKDAKEMLDDLALSVAGAALDEESAQLAVERAQQNLVKVSRDPAASNLDKRQADLDYREAQQRLKEAQDRNADLKAQAADANKKGVEGSDAVARAKDGVNQATKNEADAEANLAQTRKDAQAAYVQAIQDQRDAEKNLADTRAQAAREMRDAQRNLTSSQQGVADAMQRVTDAQQGIADAQVGVVEAQQNLADASKAAADGMGKASTSATALNAAMAKLSPEGRKFVRFLHDEFMPAWAGVKTAAQEALLPDAQTALRKIERLVKPVTAVVKATAGVLGDLMVKAADLVTSPEWQRDIVSIGTNNATAIGLFGDAAINLLTPLKDILFVLGDGPNSLLQRFARWTQTVSDNIEKTVGAARANGDLAAFFQKTGDVIAQWGRIIGNIGTGLFNIGKDAAPAGQLLTDSFEKATAKFVKWTEDNAPAITKFFNDAVPVVQTFADIMLQVATLLGDIMTDPNNLKMMQAIRDTLMPAIRRLVDAFLDANNGGQIVQIVSDLADAVTALVEAGVLGSFLDVLQKIVDVLKAIAENKYGAGFVGFLLKTSAYAAPILLLAGAVGALAEKLGKLTKITGLGKVAAAIKGLFTAGATSAANEATGPKTKGKEIGKTIGQVFWTKAMPVYVTNQVPGGGDTVVPGGGKDGPGKHRTPPKSPGRKAAGRAGSALGLLALLGISEVDWSTVLGPDLGKKAKAYLDSNPAIGAGVSGAMWGSFLGPYGAAAGFLGGTLTGMVSDMGVADSAKALGLVVAGQIFGNDFASRAASLLGKVFGNEPKSKTPAGPYRPGADPSKAPHSSFNLPVGQAPAKQGGGFLDSLFGTGFTDTLKKRGGDIVDGLKEGISARLTAIRNNTVRDWNNNVVEPFKALFGIHSPSTLFFGFAGNIIDGFINGLASLPRRFGQKLGEIGTNLSTWITKTVPTAITTGWTTVRTKFAAKWDEVKGDTATKFSQIRTNVQTWITKTAPTAVTNSWTTLRKKFSDKWGEVSADTSTRFSTIRTNLQTWITKTAPQAVSNAWTTLRGRFSQKWDEVKTDAGTKFGQIRGNIVTWITRTAPQAVTGAWSALSTVWSSKWSGLKATGETALRGIRDRVTTWMGLTKTAFQTGVTNIGKAWAQVQAAAKKPIQYVVDTVYNNGIRGVWNRVAHLIPKAPELAYMKFAKGGVLPGYAPGRDRIHALMSPGEGVLVPEAVKGLARNMGTSAQGAIQSINSAFSSRVSAPIGTAVSGATQAFSKGGVVRGGKAGLQQFARILSGLGFQISENPAWGGVTPGAHTKNSLHYTGDAIDVNYDGQGQAVENTKINSIVAAAQNFGLRSIWQTQGHYDHAHFDDGKGGGSFGDIVSGSVHKIISGGKSAINGAKNIAGNIGDFFMGNLRNAAAGLLNPIKDKMFAKHGRFSGKGFGTGFGSLASGMVGTSIDKMLGFLGSKDKDAASQNVTGSGAGRWSGEVLSVLSELGQSSSLLPWVLRLIDKESSGDPNAQNNTDINARNGIPSQGLMQTVPPTFNAYAGPYRNRGIRDPHANIYAGLSYGMAEYGSIWNIPGIASMIRGGAYKAYDTGGMWESGTTGVNLTGKPEAVFTNPQWSVLSRIASQAVTRDKIADGPSTHIGTLIEEGAVQFHVDGGVAGLDKTSERTMNDGLRQIAATGIFGG